MTIRKRSRQATGNLKNDPSLVQEYGIIFKTLLIGTVSLTAILFILLCINYFVIGNDYALNRIFLCLLAFAYLGILYTFWKKRFFLLAAWFLIMFYGLLAALTLYSWGPDDAFALLLLAIFIILAGMLLSAKYTLYATGYAIALLVFLQSLVTFAGVSSIGSPGEPLSTFGDVAGSILLLGTLGIISWLFGHQTERLQAKNRAAEKALRREKQLLETRVEKRTRELKQAQLEEMEQLYKFAEMGQLSAALLHDLANHLSVLTFDIADLDRKQHSETLDRAQESITYLEDMIDQARQRLQGKVTLQRFNVREVVQENIQLLAKKLADAHITITVSPTDKAFFTEGDPLRLGQVLLVLITNSIEAYKDTQANRTINITLTETRQAITITIRDHGSGISKARQSNLFKPVPSTKKDGKGIGLFIAHQIIEMHFKGQLTFNPKAPGTEFSITLPFNTHGS
jgi:signal transduction histidine kinase